MVLAVHLVGCLLLVVAGVAKLRDPRGAVLAAGRFEVAGPAALGRSLGAAEVVLGLVAIWFVAAFTAAAVAIAYAVFAGVAGAHVRSDDTRNCGCFGAASAPMHPLHVAVDACFAAAAALVAVGAWERPGLATLPANGVVHMALIAVAVALVYVMLTSFVGLLSATRRPAQERA